MEKAAKEIGTEILFEIPRNEIVQEAESNGKTVVEYAPDSMMNSLYKELATKLMEEV